MGQCASCHSVKKQQNTNFDSYIEAITWNNNKYNLFDYENKEPNINQFKLQPGMLNQKGSAINFQKLSVAKKPNCIGSIDFEKNHFVYTSNCNEFDYGLNEQNIWQSLSPYNSQNTIKFEMYRGMVFRIGSLRYRVNDLSNTNVYQNCSSEKSLYENSPSQNDDESHKQFPKTKICRICYSSQSTQKNPIVSVCQCSGSLKWIHLKCLQEWTMRKVSKKEKNSQLSIFYWKDLKCEICHSKLNQFIISEDQQHCSLIDIPKPKEKYLILEIFNHKDNEIKGIKLIQFPKNKNKLTIGRGKESDIQLQDSSVSRLHASICYENSKLYLQDHNSKFGTLVLLPQQVNFNKLDTRCGIQIGCNFYRIHLEQKDNQEQSQAQETIYLAQYQQQELVQEEERIFENEDIDVHNPYVFDEVPELSMLDITTTQQLRETQFPSFESSKFKIVETNQGNPFNAVKNNYMKSTELLKQLSSNQLKY